MFVTILALHTQVNLLLYSVFCVITFRNYLVLNRQNEAKTTTKSLTEKLRTL